MKDDRQHTALKKISKLQPDLLCTTVDTSLRDLKYQGIHNILCVLVPHLAPVENETKVVMPQTKAVLNHLSTEVRAAVSRILRKTCQLANGA